MAERVSFVAGVRAGLVVSSVDVACFSSADQNRRQGLVCAFFFQETAVLLIGAGDVFDQPGF